MAVVMTTPAVAETGAPDTLPNRYRHVRATSLRICEPLQIEDYVVQSMPDASPAKWHLAHTSWFFEQFLLKPFHPNYRPYHKKFEFLFNSYYQSVGPMHERPRRGLLTRPTVRDILHYRTHIDEHIESLLAARPDDERLFTLLALGMNHEQQHQELLYTDIKHLFFCNPLLPAYHERSSAADAITSAEPMRFITFEGGIHEIGNTSKHFCFDNELPRHRVLVESGALADRLTTSGEYLEFIRDGGYRHPALWLSDGWQTVTRENWTRPLYWAESLDAEFTLSGMQGLDLAAPVSHLSYYEAEAFARWAGARLPSEAEWELAAARLQVQGNLLETGALHPLPASQQARTTGSDTDAWHQLFGDTWEWTSSPYIAYPGYRCASGALGEYNGKFMCSQMVLRGGSCVTPADHIRASYRNFFYPGTRWQFAGLRLARNA